MLALFISLALLGLAAVDPTGIAAMPVLLLQKDPYRRCLIFLGGSFVSLMLMGLLFAQGFGSALLRFETRHGWLVPGTEAVAGVILLVIGLIMWRQLWKGKLSVEPSKKLMQRLELGGWQLFSFGALLVMIQSLVDVVFVVAMIHIGQLHLSTAVLAAAVATYAVTALLLQGLVVVAYGLSPERGRQATLSAVHGLLNRYANQAVIVVSILLGFILLGLASASLVNQDNGTTSADGVVTFEGKVTAVNNQCASDGICSITIDGSKEVVTDCSMVFDDSVCPHEAAVQAGRDVGDQVRVRAKKQGDLYSLYCASCSITAPH